MRSSKTRSHRFLIALVLLLSASALLVAASSAANNRPILGDPNEVYDARIVLFHNAKIDTRLSPQFHQEPHLYANSDNNVDKSNSVNQYLLHVDERLSLEQRKSIEDTLGAPLIKYLPHNTWHIMTTPTTATALQSLSGVHWVGHYHPKYKLHINLIEGNHNLKLAKYKPIMAKLLEAAAGATNMTHADKKLLAHHFSHLSASSVQPEGTILGLNPFELYAVLPKWNKDIGAVENLAASFTERLQKDHAALAERVKITAGSGDLVEGSCKNEADVQALADFFTAQSETYMVTRKSIQRVHNRWARGVSQSNLGNPTYAANGAATTVSISQSKGLFGQNQVIGISDSGLDWQSCFFHDTAFPAGPTFYPVTATTVGTPTAASVNANHRKVIQYVAWADRLDENGHGTHVSGSVAGKLYTANNAYAPVNGMSQEAKIAFYDIGIGTAGSLTVPNNYDRTLFPWARVAGAFIHSNSWGSPDNTYSIDAAWTDNYMWNNKDFLILVAAGNDGNLPNTVGSPATAKNIVTVGASTNSKEGWEGMFCATGYNLNTGLCNVGRQFGTTSYDKQHIAGFSSVGPTRDGRLKPEVAAPGMFILSARNRQTASTSCTAAAGTLMTFNAGTSMATPVTAGDVGIIRQWFTEGYYPSGLKNDADGFIPSGSLMKAMLISGSRMLDRYGGTVDAGGFLFSNTATQPTPVPLAAAPGMVQGYGRVEIDNSIYFQGSPHKTIVLGLSAVANGRRTEPQFTTTGQAAQTYKMCIQSVSLEVPVRIALVWTDAPGQPNAANPLVNNLDLSVAAKGQTYLGNSKANVAGGTADIRNPSEVVTFDERSAFTAKTDITISVAATRISLGPQPYTLVVTGDVTEGDCTAATAAPAETFVWVAENFGACSAECTKPGQAAPTQTRKVTCVGSINGPTTDETKCAGKQKPATIQACNTHSCGSTTYEYVVGQWSACSKTCGGGTQTRPVTCQSIQTGTVVDESNCGDHTKPATEQPCNTQACIGSTSAPKNAAEWRVGDCSACSAQCTCTRDVSCYYYGVKVSDYLCAPENGGPAMKPATTTTCTGGSCPSTNPTNAPVETFAWAASDWGACSVGCTKAGSSGGIQTRTIKCRSSMGYDTADNRCASSARPAAAAACNLDACPDTTTVKRDFNHQWLMGGWGRCDATTKTQSRWVICATTNGDNADSAKCEGHAGIKPATTRACTPLTPYDSMTVAQRDANVAYTWYAERYGDPTTWCGGNGQIYRYAWCLGTDGKVADTRAKCDPSLKPAEVDKCLQCDRACVAQPRWVPGEYWMGCSTIDPCCGQEHRHAFCIDSNGQKIADTTACGGNGTAQEYFYQTPCVQCPNGDKTKCGQFPKGLYPDRGDGPALPGSKVPGTPAMPAAGPLAATGSTTTPKPGTTNPAAKLTYIRMQANGLRLTGALTTEAGLKAFLVQRIAVYLSVDPSVLTVTYFTRTGPDTNARVVIIVGMPATNTVKSFENIRDAIDEEVLPSEADVFAQETASPNDDVAASSDSMSSSTMTIAIAAGASAVGILAIVGGICYWQKQKNTAVKHTAKMGPEVAMTH